MKIFIGIYVTVSVGMTSFTFAVERPSPEEFSEEIGLFWYEEKYDELKARVDEVYGAHPDFIPRLLRPALLMGCFGEGCRTAGKR